MNNPLVSIIPASPGSTDELRRLMRSQIPVARNWAYFDHAAVGPLPKASADAMREFVSEAESDGDSCWPKWASAAQRLRSAGAQLLHCKKNEVALIPNTTFGINLIASSFPWRTHRGAPPNIVVLENEFSSNLLPWHQLSSFGVEVRHVPVDAHGVVDLNRIRSLMDSNTQLVSASWVGYVSGYRLDLARLSELVHGSEAKLFVDAIQGLGVFPCNVEELGIDFLAADGHKWMLGPEGAGFLYIREANLEMLRPMMLGWGSIQGAHTFNTHSMVLKKDASRYEGGSANHVGQIGLERSVQLLLELGCHVEPGLLGQAVLETASVLEDRLRGAGALVHRELALASQYGSELTGIVCFELPGRDPNEVRNQLIQDKVMLSVRHGRLRAAVHAYNDASDVEQLVQGIQQN
jgi:selenocysteine lyase/cysteine desulfurase